MGDLPTKPPENASAVLHVAVAVPELDAALRFYREVLGFVAGPQRFTAPGPDSATLTGLFLRKGKFFLELIESDAGEEGPERIPLKHYGYQHVAFRVDDVDRTLALAKRHGGRIVTERRLDIPTPNGTAPITIAFCTDPAGNLLELIGLPDQEVADFQATSLNLKGLGWAADLPTVG